MALLQYQRENIHYLSEEVRGSVMQDSLYQLTKFLFHFVLNFCSISEKSLLTCIHSLLNFIVYIAHSKNYIYTCILFNYVHKVSTRIVVLVFVFYGNVEHDEDCDSQYFDSIKVKLVCKHFYSIHNISFLEQGVKPSFLC